MMLKLVYSKMNIHVLLLFYISDIFPNSSLILNIFAAILFAVVVVTSIVLAVVCSKKRKLKNIVITKNIVSKSNSYKSNVSGCK